MVAGTTETAQTGSATHTVDDPLADRRLGRRGLAITRPGVRAWAFAAYLVAAIALTLPVWVSPATKWPSGPGDPMAYMQFLGWFPFAISHDLNPLLDTYVNLPAGTNSMWGGNFPFAAAALWPVTAMFGVIVSYNIAIVGGLALDGWCTFLWLRRHARHSVAAWLGGLLMVLGPFASTRAYGHLGFLLVFPVPLLFMAIERVVTDPRHGHLRWGATIGTLAAIQLLCCEEIVALFTVAVGSTVVIAGLLFPRATKTRLVPCVKTLAVALAVFLAISAAPLGYQFLGPGRIVGPIQAPNTFVTDVVNLVVPGGATALQPSFAAVLAGHWAGGFMENDAYIGIPLLIVSIYAVIRWRRDPWLRVVGFGTAAALVWSLGAFLHIDGITHHLLPLPGRLLDYLPVVDNILPARFDLFIDLGLAALVAVFVDRGVLAGSWRARVVGGLAFVLVCVTLAPRMPLPVYVTDTPRYFLPGGDIDALRQGTVALVVPYGDGESTMDPLLWQAESGFRVRMVAGAIYTAARAGGAAFGESLWPSGTTLDCVMQLLQAGVSTDPCTSDPVGAVRVELDQLGVQVILMGPMAYGTEPALERPMEAFLSRVAGTAPRIDEGALVWPYTA